MNIIILEDDPVIATQISDLVEDCGNHVSGVTGDAETAVSMAIDLRPDLMIADIDLGAGGDGVEAAVNIREQAHIKSIFLTGSNDFATRDRAQAAWPLNFITKPFSQEYFKATLLGVGRLLEDDLAKRYIS